MKKVTIPTCANPFVVIVNGIKYTYPAGETMEVPDDVAVVIEQHYEMHHNQKDGGRTTTVDLSAFETEGKIVETYDDGSTNTTTMEFDANGNPVKITDGYGNETVLTW